MVDQYTATFVHSRGADKGDLEVVTPEASPFEEGVLSLEEQEVLEKNRVDLANENFFENLVYTLPYEELSRIGQEVITDLELDESSRADQVKTLLKGLQNLGISRAEDLNVGVYEDSCTAFHPLLLESAVTFQSAESQELLPAGGPVKVQIIGEATEEDEAQASRIKAHMNWQLMEEILDYSSNWERALFQTALFGCAFKKWFYNPTLMRLDNCLVSFDDFVINNNSSSIEAAERYSQIIYRSEAELQREAFSGLYDTSNLGNPYTYQKNDLGREKDKLLGVNVSRYEGYVLVEQHVFKYLPDDPLNTSGLALPYIITVEKNSGVVLSVYRNWEKGGNPFKKKEYFVKVPFIPAFGFYDLGLIHIVGDYQKTLTVILRAIVDAGQLANIPGGFKNKSARLPKGDTGEFKYGEWKDVEITDGRIADAFFPLPIKEPSGTLLQMFGLIQQSGQQFANSTNQVVADSTNYGPVGTTMALLEASTKMFSAVHKRLHEAQKRELNLLAAMNYDYLPDDPNAISFNVPNRKMRIFREDYSGVVDVVPVADPNISSNAHRMTLANAKLQAAMLRPDIHNMREIFKEYYLAMGVNNIDKILPSPQSPQPNDPLTDILLASQGQPIKAFPEQDHDAHIAVKGAFLESSEFGANAALNPAVPVLQANIREHVVMKFQARMQAALQVDPNVQAAAKLVSKTTEYLASNPDGLKDSKQLLAEAQVMLQKNKAKELEIKQNSAEVDAAVKLLRAALDQKRLELDFLKEDMRLTAEKEIVQYESVLKMLQDTILTPTSA